MEYCNNQGPDEVTKNWRKTEASDTEDENNMLDITDKITQKQRTLDNVGVKHRTKTLQTNDPTDWPAMLKYKPKKQIDQSRRITKLKRHILWLKKYNLYIKPTLCPVDNRFVSL